MSPFGRYVIPAALVAAAVYLLLLRYAFSEPLYRYLLAVNVSMFMLYGIDKLAAMRSFVRVPERLLHLTALAGGTPAALLGQQLFWHKVSKRRFMLWYWGTVALQAGFLYVWFYTDYRDLILQKLS